MYPTNPAAVILPVVERIAPDRLAEVFWRAVALHPRLEPDREDQLQSSYLGFECMLLARTTARWPPRSSSRWILTSARSPHERARTTNSLPASSWPRPASTPGPALHFWNL